MSDPAVPVTREQPFDIPSLGHDAFERSPQPLVAVEGAAHVVRSLNPAFARLVGRRAEELIGRPFAAAVPEGDGNGCAALLDRVFGTGVPENLAEQEHRHTSPAYWSYSAWV